MVLASHVIFGAYGFWLPNDPRGSWSDFVASWELFQFGPATKVTTRRSVANAPHDRALRTAAKEALKLPPVHFSGIQARAIGQAFGVCAARGGVSIYACSVLPEHVHLVIGRHTCKVEWIVNLLKGEATRKLRDDGLHPFVVNATSQGKVPSCWGRKLWKVFLNTPEDVLRAIRYVEDNPLKEHRPRQRWTFVREYLEALRQ